MVMKLDQKFPIAVRVRDKLCNSVTVLAEYPHIPHKCQGCNEFGHFLLCCPKNIVPVLVTTSPPEPQEVSRSNIPSSKAVVVVVSVVSNTPVNCGSQQIQQVLSPQDQFLELRASPLFLCQIGITLIVDGLMLQGGLNRQWLFLLYPIHRKSYITHFF